jgi:tetratricopeptide (TPR) repeat protein
MSSTINKRKLFFLFALTILLGTLFALISSKPKTELEYRQKAERIAQRQDWQALETLAKEWQQQHPTSEMSHTALGDSLRMRGNFAAAAGAYGNAIKLAPGNPELWAYHGVMMLELSNYEQAAGSCQSSVTTNPELAQAWYCLALAAAELNQAEPSLFALSKLSALNPGLHETARNILRDHICKKPDRKLPASLCQAA